MAEEFLPDLRAADGRGIRVLVLDSGVEAWHPAFGDRPPESLALETDGEGRWTIDAEAPQDAFGHGTAVCALLRAFAPQADITSLRVLGADLRAHSARVIHALEWGVAQGFQVINCSFGTSAVQHLPDYKRAVDAAFVQNAWVVAAVNGQGGLDEFPGTFPTVFGTRATALDDPLALQRIPGQVVEFAARGHDLRVAWRGGGQRHVSGSSLAAPHLAALLARLRQLGPDLNTCEARCLLYQWCRVSS
jgi:subtilisin family serine protease